ncbi:MAG: virulence factor [Chloroflexota bacterium]
MATVRIMRWRDIPSQVKVTDAGGASAARMLPNLFQQEIDRIAMREGLVDTDAYLDGWAWSAPEERDGDVETIADAVLAELVSAGFRGTGA